MKRASDAARDYDAHITKAIVNYQDDEQHVAISNSEGKYIQDVRIRTRMAVSAAVANRMAHCVKPVAVPAAARGYGIYDSHKPEDYRCKRRRVLR
ncbi:MAG: hypothetical protein ACLTDX_00765 [[Clostridium] innocuum]